MIRNVVFSLFLAPLHCGADVKLNAAAHYAEVHINYCNDMVPCRSSKPSPRSRRRSAWASRRKSREHGRLQTPRWSPRWTPSTCGRPTTWRSGAGPAADYSTYVFENPRMPKTALDAFHVWTPHYLEKWWVCLLLICVSASCGSTSAPAGSASVKRPFNGQAHIQNQVQTLLHDARLDQRCNSFIHHLWQAAVCWRRAQPITVLELRCRRLQEPLALCTENSVKSNDVDFWCFAGCAGDTSSQSRCLNCGASGFGRR